MKQKVRIGEYTLSFTDRMRLRAFFVAYGEFREARGPTAAKRMLPDMARRYGAVLVERDAQIER